MRQSSSLIIRRVLGGQLRLPLQGTPFKGYEKEGLRMIEGINYSFHVNRGIVSSFVKAVGNNNEGKAKKATSSSGEDEGLAQTRALAAAGVVGGLGYLLWATNAGKRHDNESVIQEGTADEEHVLNDPYYESSANENNNNENIHSDNNNEDNNNENLGSDSSLQSSTQEGVSIEEENSDLNNKEDEDVVVVDSHQVLGTLESVLTKSGEDMLREDEAKVQISTRAAPELVENDDGKVHDAKLTDPKENDYEAAAMAISTAMADTAADSVMSGMSHDVPNAKRTIEERSEDVQNDNVDFTLTASDLLAEAVKRRKELQEDWDEYSARHRQAEADVITLQYLLKERVEPLKKRVEELESEKQELSAAMKQQTAMFKKRLHRTLSNIEAMQKELLHAQANALAIGHEREITRERVKRQEAVDNVRLQLDAFATALKRHSDRALKAQDAHTISKAVFTIQDAFDSNGLLAKKEMQALESLKSIHEEDGVIQVAVQALSNFVENGKRVKSREQLIAEFEHNVKKTIKELSYIPKGYGGMVSSLVAKIASKLKVDEQPRILPAVGASGTDQQDGSTAFTVDAAIASTVQNLLDGEIIEATETLLRGLQGTAAEYAVRDWLTDARNTVEAHQALKLLQAHASCISSQFSSTKDAVCPAPGE